MPAKKSKTVSRFIFFSGIEETEKEDILKIVKDTKSDLPNFKNINLKANLEYDDNLDFSKFIKNVDVFFDKVRSSVDKAKKSGHVNLIGQPVHKIPGGHAPLFTSEGFASLRPDILVFFKVIPETLVYIKTDYKKAILEQKINWDYMRTYSLITGAPLKVINVEHGNIKETIKEVYELLKLVYK